MWPAATAILNAMMVRRAGYFFLLTDLWTFRIFLRGRFFGAGGGLFEVATVGSMASSVGYALDDAAATRAESSSGTACAAASAGVAEDSAACEALPSHWLPCDCQELQP